MVEHNCQQELLHVVEGILISNIYVPTNTNIIQWNFDDSKTDGPFTTSLSNSLLSPWQKSRGSGFGIAKGDFLFYIENGILRALIRIASS